MRVKFRTTKLTKFCTIAVFNHEKVVSRNGYLVQLGTSVIVRHVEAVFLIAEEQKNSW